MANPPIFFSSETIANRSVAGLPAALRALRNLEAHGVMDPIATISIAVPGGWHASMTTLSEFERLLPDCDIQCVAFDEANDMKAFDGVGAIMNQEVPQQQSTQTGSRNAFLTDEAAAHHALDRAGRQIVAATGKPTDGLVSRTINRPFSQFLSYHLLKLRGVRPIHATAAAALIGVAMAVSLFLGGSAGLYIGAVLFQLASMFDGVDGEIARATERSSKLGASLDSASDAATNAAFIAGVAFNLWQQDEALGAIASVCGLTLLAAGLAVLGLVSVRGGGPLHFDALKNDARASASPLLRFLAKIASRDVYALVFAVLILLGLASEAMVSFAVAASLWFVALLAALIRRPSVRQP